MKKVRTIRIDKEVSDNLDSICNRHGDVSWHIEQALIAYTPIKKLAKPQGTSKVNLIFATEAFEQVWAIYEKKGNRKNSLSRFSNLSNADRDAILAHVPNYVLSTPDKQYRKNFETYINQECWNDEVTPNGGFNQSGQHTGTNRKLTAVEQVEAKRAEAAARRREGLGFLGCDGDTIPQRVDGNGGTGADGDMGETLDGTFTRTN